MAVYALLYVGQSLKELTYFPRPGCSGKSIPLRRIVCFLVLLLVRWQSGSFLGFLGLVCVMCHSNVWLLVCKASHIPEFMPGPGWRHGLMTSETWWPLCIYKPSQILRVQSKIYSLSAGERKINQSKLAITSCPATELTILSFVWKISHGYSS